MSLISRNDKFTITCVVEHDKSLDRLEFPYKLYSLNDETSRNPITGKPISHRTLLEEYQYKPSKKQVKYEVNLRRKFTKMLIPIYKMKNIIATVTGCGFDLTLNKKWK